MQETKKCIGVKKVDGLGRETERIRYIMPNATYELSFASEQDLSNKISWKYFISKDVFEQMGFSEKDSITEEEAKIAQQRTENDASANGLIRKEVVSPATDFKKDITKLLEKDFFEGVCIKEYTGWAGTALETGFGTDRLTYYTKEPMLCLPEFKERQFLERLKTETRLTPYQLLRTKEFRKNLYSTNTLRLEVPSSFTQSYSACLKELGTTLDLLLNLDTLHYLKKIPLSYVKNVEWTGFKEHAQELLQNDKTLTRELNRVIALKEAMARLDTKLKNDFENRNQSKENKTKNDGGKAE